MSTAYNDLTPRRRNAALQLDSLTPAEAQQAVQAIRPFVADESLSERERKVWTIVRDLLMVRAGGRLVADVLD